MDVLLPVHISYGFPSPNKFKVQPRTTLPKKNEIRKTCDMLINTDIMSYQIISYYSTLCTLYYVVHHFTFYTNIIFDFANLSGRCFSVSESGVCFFSLSCDSAMSFTINLAMGECKTMPMTFLCLKLGKFRTCSWQRLSAAVLQIDLWPAATGQKTKMC